MDGTPHNKHSEPLRWWQTNPNGQWLAMRLLVIAFGVVSFAFASWKSFNVSDVGPAPDLREEDFWLVGIICLTPLSLTANLWFACRAQNIWLKILGFVLGGVLLVLSLLWVTFATA